MSQMGEVLERISAWESAGLIDSATAARLRLSETERGSIAEAPVQPQEPGRRGPSSVGAIFGPGVTLGEMFAYLGGGFILGAYESFLVRATAESEGSLVPLAVGWTVGAVVLAAVGFGLTRGDARRRRAAGVLFALAVLHSGLAAMALAAQATLPSPPVFGIAIIGTGVATIVAIGLRMLHAALLTQVALLASVTSFALAILSWLENTVAPGRSYDDLGNLIPWSGPDPALLVAVSVAWWLVLAVVLGFVGLAEAGRSNEDPGAGRRASLTRLWAGLVAVIGVATSVTRSDYSASAPYVFRVIPPWLGELVILVVAAVLVERAFRRDASTFVYAAAIGLIVALTDFNYTYLSTNSELGLLVEGVILLGVGVGAVRLQRRIGEAEPAPEAEQPAVS
jgi:hypothetical protein